MDAHWLFVGLGNPGTQYQYTRHNMGFFLVDGILRRAAERKSMRLALVRETDDYILHSINFAGAFCLLLRPLTYMNLSGRAVSKIMGQYRMQASQVLVAHDELDLELGRIKLKRGGSANGHNGVLSIEEALNTQSFFRLRMGIGRPQESWQTSDYVLNEMSEKELLLAQETVAKALYGLEILLRRGVSFAQQNLHSKAKTEE